jgi:hypothetical protein
MDDREAETETETETGAEAEAEAEAEALAEAEGDAQIAADAAAEEPATVTVTLERIPRRARIFVDGERHGREPITFERADEDHVIVVRVRGRRPFRVEHNAIEDGSYVVRSGRGGRMRRIGRRMRRGMRDPGMLLGNPGF